MVINLRHNFSHIFIQFYIDCTLSCCKIAAIFITNTPFDVRNFCARAIPKSSSSNCRHCIACKSNSSCCSNIYTSVHGGYAFCKFSRAWCANVAFQFCIVYTRFYKLEYVVIKKRHKKTYLNCSTNSVVPESVFGGDVVVEALVGLGVVVVLLGLGFGRLVVFLF